MKTHLLKTWPEYYSRVESGQKKFELRKNDRDFQVGDTLILQEYDPISEFYTCNEIKVSVDYILHGPCFGIEEGFCVMSISPITN
jgi:hypothetical protein